MPPSRQRFRALARKARPLSLSGTPVTTGTEGVVWPGFTVSARGGKAPYVYSATNLPAWTSIGSSTGIIAAGTPTGNGTISGIDVYVTDANGTVVHLGNFSLTISAASGFFVTASAASYTPNAAFMPRLLDRIVPRSTLVPAGEDRINLRTAMVWPHSGPATQYMVSGPNAAYFDSVANDEIKLASATRASMAPGDYPLTITPLQGATYGTAKTLTVRLMASNKCLFVSQSLGSEVATGTDPSTPRKYLPDTAQATGSKLGLGAGWVVFMRREIHRCQHTGADTLLPSVDRVGYHGGAGANSSGHLWIELGGYGPGLTEATLSGDEVLTGAASVTQAEVDGNPNYASIVKYNLTTQPVAAGNARWGAGMFDGDDMMWRAQFPAPVNPYVNQLPDGSNPVGSETTGFRNIPSASSGTSYMRTDNANLTSPNTKITIKDPIFASRYGNVAASKLPRIFVLTANNNTAEFNISTYDYATSTVEVLNTTEYLSVINGKCAFAVLHSKLDIVAPGQYAFSSDLTTAYVWPKTNTAVSLSRRERAVDWGFDVAGGYVTYSGGIIQRFCDTQGRGACFDCYTGSPDNTVPEINIIGVWMRQNSGESCILATRGGALNGAILDNCNIELNRFTENQCSGSRFTVLLRGPNPGTLVGIDAQTKGKFQANSFELYGINRSAAFLQGADGFQVRWNNISFGQTLHGDGVPVYNNNYPQVNNFVKINGNDFIATTRCLTFDDASHPVSVEVSGNLLLNGDDSNLPSQSPAIAGFNGWIGGEIMRNIILNYGTNNYATGVNFSANNQPHNFHNNVSLGFSMPSGWTGSISNNLFTAQPSANDNINNGGTHSGNTILTGGSRIFQFAGITPAMESVLGSGEVGCFRSVA